MSNRLCYEQPEDVKKILDSVKNLSKGFFEQKAVITPEIITHRWGSPDITLTWKATDGVNRNIHFVVEGEPSRYYLTAEANAWIDNEIELKRAWNNYVFNGSVALGAPEELLINGSVIAAFILRINDLYDKISQFKQNDLVKITEMQPKPY